MAGTAVAAVETELAVGAIRSVTREAAAQIPKIVVDLEKLRAAIQAGSVTLVNELRDDHATFKAAADASETLVEELGADHATFKTAVDQTKTLVDELHDDHATFRTNAVETETLIEEMHDDHATMITAFDALRRFIQNHITTGDPGVGIGTAVAKVRTNATTTFTINGVGFSKASTDDLWTLSGTNIPNSGSNVGGFLLLVDNAGAASVQQATSAASEAALVWPTPTADRCVFGAVTITNASGADFVPGTTGLDAAGITDTYYDGLTLTGVRDKVLPAGPATLTAPKPASPPATLTAAKPAAGPATLAASIAIPSAPATISAAAASTTAVDTAGDLTASTITVNGTEIV